MKQHGLYKYVCDGEIIYIGKSNSNIDNRIAAHKSECKFNKKMCGITVKDMAVAFGFASPNPIYKWQNGQCMPPIDNLVAIASMFHTTLDNIVVTK